MNAVIDETGEAVICAGGERLEAAAKCLDKIAAKAAADSGAAPEHCPSCGHELDPDAERVRRERGGP